MVFSKSRNPEEEEARRESKRIRREQRRAQKAQEFKKTYDTDETKETNQKDDRDERESSHRTSLYPGNFEYKETEDAEEKYAEQRNIQIRSKYSGKQFERFSDDEPPPVYPMDPEEEEEEPEPDPNESELDSSKLHCSDIIPFVILGYLLGLVLVLMWYYGNPQKASEDLTAKWWLMVFLVFLVLVLCYSRATRCVVALTLPTLFSYMGRALLIAFAFFIAATGPVMNIIKNIGIMAHSLACGQSHLKEAITPMMAMIGEPIHAVERAVFLTITEVGHVMEELEDVLERLEAGVASIFGGYTSCGEWLQLQQQSFEKEMGTPFDRCIAAGTISMIECRNKFGSQKHVCNAKQRFEWFCDNLKELKSFFENSVDLQQQIVDDIYRRVTESFFKIRQIFEVSITFDHNLRPSETDEGNLAAVDREISEQMSSHNFILAFVWLDIIVIILLFIVLLRSILFHMRYLGSDEYGNYYLTREFMLFDQNHHQQGFRSVLPLRAAEEAKYTKLNSLRLLKSELAIMSRSILFLILTCAQLFCICLTEYSLFVMMSLMSYYSHQTANMEVPPYTKVVVEGGGIIADVMRGLIFAFEPLAKDYMVDTEHCAPMPEPPKFARYYEILGLCFLAWFLLLLEPYGLRQRYRIMGCFYPDDASRRTSFLHRRILLDRASFFKMARRRARALHLYADRDDEFLCVTVLSTVISWCCGCIVGPMTGKHCIICRKRLTKTDNVQCDTPGCKGAFCQICFLESDFYCCLCTSPQQYGDNSDFSEIGDSSDDPEAIPFRTDKIYCYHDSVHWGNKGPVFSTDVEKPKRPSKQTTKQKLKDSMNSVRHPSHKKNSTDL